MPSNRIALTSIAAACITAAGVGGYFATRQNLAGVAAPSAAAASPSATASAQPVQETEALVSAPGEAVPTPDVTSQTPASATTARRPETAVRPAVRRPESQAAVAKTAEPQALDRSWPTGTASNSSASTSSATTGDSQSQTQRADDHAVESPGVPEPAPKSFEELVVSADSVIGLQTEALLSSERSRVEDRVEARVVRDVRVGGTVAIPAGTRALGNVVVVERGGKFKDCARLGIRFQTLVLADGTRLPISTETIYRYGDAPGNPSASRIGGGAVIGAIIGGIIGGGKGAAIGATTGAGAGTASVMAGDRNEAVFPAGAEVTARIVSPVTVTIEKE